MPFNEMPEVVHKAASSKGGKIKVDKGFAKNPELAREAGRKGGNAKQANRGKERKPEEDSQSRNDGLLERVLTNLDEG